MSDINLESGGKKNGGLRSTVGVFSKIITCNNGGGKL